MTDKWDFLIAEFHDLGGKAENVCQKQGKFGRGIFSINPHLRSRIYTPSKLMIKKEDICLEDNNLRIMKDKNYSQEIRDFFNYYQDNFSWGRGGKKMTGSFEQGLSTYSSHVKELIKNNFLVSLSSKSISKGLTIKSIFFDLYCASSTGKAIFQSVIGKQSKSELPSVKLTVALVIQIFLSSFGTSTE